MKIFRSFQDLSKGLENNEFTCEELVNFYLKEIKTNDKCNSFVETFDESSIEQAKLVDRDISNNNKKKLSGLIIGIKDNMCCLLYTSPSPRDATLSRMPSSA